MINLTCGIIAVFKVLQLSVHTNLQYIAGISYFCTFITGRPHSSMDRISDSGSDDLGSNPDGVTY
jgi:hypothetical protein